jgi:hypothetical protein
MFKSVMRFILVLLSIQSFLQVYCLGKAITLVENGNSPYSIVISRNASGSDSVAAQVLQTYVNKISGATLPIREYNTKINASYIFIGSASHNSRYSAHIDWKSLEEDGFTILTEGKNLIIAGGTEKGSLYGVYSFIETYLGCRKYSPTVEIIPHQQTIILQPINDTQIPKIKFRDDYFYDPGYMAWHKLDNHSDMFAMYVHTFRSLVPPEKYFQNHPEYFSKVKSGRIQDGQLCLTNPDVFHIVVDELRQRIEEKPEYRFWSVSQNDTFSPCECDSCTAINEREGSMSGSLLAFVNRVADKFPDKIISTLAYQYTRAAPKNIRPRSNVNIMLCSIECNRCKPLEKDPGSASFINDVSEWTQRTNNIYLWDYVVQFRNLISPFPNLRVLQPNIQYFAKHGITNIFEQGSGKLSSEFKELRTYLIAKLLWNPDISIDSTMNDFLHGYYGNAAPFIREYIDQMHNAMEASGEQLGIYGYPLPSENGYLSPRMIDLYISLFDQAEASVKDVPDILQRVQAARLPLQFAQLEQAKVFGTGDRGFFESDSHSGWRVKSSMRQLLETFVDRCNRFGYTAIEEMGTTPDQYYRATSALLETSMKNHLALFKPVILTIPASTKYHSGDQHALTDGLTGPDDYHMNWLGFEGTDMVATVDLGSIHYAHLIRTNFLQDINSWIFMPLEVEYSTSIDGEHYRVLGTIKNTIDEKRNGAGIAPFSLEFQRVKTRYIRMTATSMKHCPLWHKGAGGLAWIFADEIVVE